MKPPIVYEVTRPSTHNTTKTAAIVHNMIHSLSVCVLLLIPRDDDLDATVVGTPIGGIVPCDGVALAQAP